jgi:hypothetical protein
MMTIIISIVIIIFNFRVLSEVIQARTSTTNILCSLPLEHPSRFVRKYWITEMFAIKQNVEGGFYREHYSELSYSWSLLKVEILSQHLELWLQRKMVLSTFGSMSVCQHMSDRRFAQNRVFQLIQAQLTAKVNQRVLAPYLFANTFAPSSWYCSRVIQ